MDQNVQRLLTDKLYDKRKQGALEYDNDVKLFHPLTPYQAGEIGA
jgi:hypothetical protein